MTLAHAVKPITYLKNRTADVVRQVARDGRPMVITQRGQAKVVVMDVSAYDRWREALALLKLFSIGEEEARAGRVVSQKAALARIARATRSARRA